MAIHLGRPLLDASSNQPGRPLEKSLAPAGEPATHAPSLFGFAPGEACHAMGVTVHAVRSYRTFSPLPAVRPKPRDGGSFSVALSLGSPQPEVIRRRFSVEPGLSSTSRGYLTLGPQKRREAAAIRSTDCVYKRMILARVKSAALWPTRRGNQPRQFLMIAVGGALEHWCQALILRPFLRSPILFPVTHGIIRQSEISQIGRHIPAAADHRYALICTAWLAPCIRTR